MRLIDGYECEIVLQQDLPEDKGAFDGVAWEAAQSPILPEHVFDVETGRTWAEKTPDDILADITRMYAGFKDSTPEATYVMPLFIFRYPKSSRKVRKAHAIWVSRALGTSLKEAKDICRNASRPGVRRK